MKERIEPQHAELPLWPNKSDMQKYATLSRLLLDLGVYAKAKGINVPKVSVRIPSDTPLEKAREQILAAYKEVLGEERGGILSSLDLIQPFNETERVNIEKTKKLIAENPNILNMNCEPGHVTGSALIIDPLTRRVLLHKHKKLGIWLQFGGHPDYELAIVDVAKREASEESGLKDLQLVSLYGDPTLPIDVDIQEIPEKDLRPEHIHADLRFLLTTSSPNSVAAAEGESGDFWWVSVEEALLPNPNITPPVHRLISKAKIYLDTKST